MVTPPALPDLSNLDPDALRQLILAKQNELLTQHAEFHQTLLSSKNEIEHLKLVIAKLQRMMFGRKSEKIAHEIEQLELKLEELEVRAQEEAASPAVQSQGTQPPRRPARGPLMEHLAREIDV